MQVKHIWTLLCQKVTIDQSSNSASLVDLIENITVNLKANVSGDGKVPTDKELENSVKRVPINFRIVSHWFVGEGEFKGGEVAQVVIYDPKDKLLGEFKLELKSKKDHLFHRTVMELNEMVVTSAGIYRFEVQLKAGDEYFTVSSVPLNVRLNIEK